MVDGTRAVKRGKGKVTFGTMRDVTDLSERQRAPRLQGEELVTAPIRNNEQQHGHDTVQSSQPGTDQPPGETGYQEEGAGAGDAVVPDKEKLSPNIAQTPNVKYDAIVPMVCISLYQHFGSLPNNLYWPLLMLTPLLFLNQNVCYYSVSKTQK